MWLTALIMGLAGSLHCAGMCSPLAMTITNMTSPAISNRLLYNAGRITTYGILGAIITTVGLILPLPKVQNILSILLGIILLVMGITGVTGVRIPLITTAIIKFTALLKKIFSGFIQQKHPGSLLLLGALNGLLPCGLTFLALTFCITLTTPFEGFLYMLLFGAGTLPVMLGLISVFQFFTKKSNLNIKRVTTCLLILSGILLVARVFFVHLPEGHSTPQGIVDIVLCR